MQPPLHCFSGSALAERRAERTLVQLRRAAQRTGVILSQSVVSMEALAARRMFTVLVWSELITAAARGLVPLLSGKLRIALAARSRRTTSS